MRGAWRNLPMSVSSSLSEADRINGKEGQHLEDKI
jgi:hypothetical protein